MNFIINFFHSLANYTGLDYNFLIKLVETLTLFIILFFIKSITLQFLFFKKIDDIKIYYHWRKIIGYVYIFIIILGIINLWLNGFKYIATFLGLLSAGLAIALKDFVFNFVSWFFILIRRPFEIGDRIEVNGIRGDVIDIRIFQFTLLEIGNWVDSDQSTGRIVHIGNSFAVSNSIYNYSKGFQYIWDELTVIVTFESNWKKVEDILYKIVKEHGEQLSKNAQRKVKEASKKYLIFYKNLNPIVYVGTVDFGVKLTLRYLVDPRKRRFLNNKFWRDILELFSKEDDIDFAYPTTRFYNNQIEGKVK